jgi:adenylate cyclase
MLCITFHNQQRHVQKTFDVSPVEIRDQQIGTLENRTELQDQRSVNCHAVIEQAPSNKGHVQIENLGSSIVLHTGRRVHRGQSVELSLPTSFSLGDTQFQVFATEADHELDFALAELGATASGSAAVKTSPGPETLTAWLESLGELQSSVAGSREFFQQAARAVFNPGGLDGGIVVKRSGEDWTIAASYVPYPDFGIGYRQDIVDQAAASGATIYHDASKIDQDRTIDDLHSAIASPVLDASGEVVAVVYGFRSLHRTNNRRGIRALEGQFVQVVSNSVSAALTRMETEAEAARSRILLEHAFSPTVVRELETSPKILEGTSREVTVLFADLRGFTTISEKIGTQQTYELLSDLMDSLSQVIVDNDGLIIDFYGDGLSAFWNAPIEQANHASLACSAAMQMIECLPNLNSLWYQRLGVPLKIGIGINTGIAQVGNSGSRSRVKYGPRGSTVNIASRLENMTKKIGIPILVSQETANQASNQYISRRVCKTKLPGFPTSMDMFQIFEPQSSVQQVPYFEAYERALEMYETDRLDDAIHELANLQFNLEGEPASAFLLAQAIRQREGSMESLRKTEDTVAIAGITKPALTE